MTAPENIAGSIPTQQQTYVVASTKTFRKYARILPQPDDIVLEVGASFGRTTEILLRHAKTVFAIEHSRELFDVLRTNLGSSPHLNLLWHDARDIYGALALCPSADVLFFDIGSDAPAHIAIYILQLYTLAYQPRVVVVRNIALAGLFGEVVRTEFPDKKGYQRYKALPSKEEIITHYQRDDSKSAQKFVQRELKRRANDSNFQAVDESVEAVGSSGI